MRNLGYSIAVVAVVALVLLVGLTAHPLVSESAGQSGRGPLPAGGLEDNFDLATVDRTEAARGEYPPRALGLLAQRKPPSDSWLLDADNDRDRFRRIEVALRGLDVHMVEIGARFGMMHDAIGRGNLRLAELEADKSIESARIAMLKRPGFSGDEGLKYMGAPQWTSLRDALEFGDVARSRAAFLDVRQTCMTCHTSRGMEFLNDSNLFESTAAFAGAPQAAAAAVPPAPR